jgi:hypothetical protein
MKAVRPEFTLESQGCIGWPHFPIEEVCERLAQRLWIGHEFAAKHSPRHEIGSSQQA